MMSRIQISLDPELRRRAREKAAQLGISFAEYVRRLLDTDLGVPAPGSGPAALFNLGSSAGGDVARDTDRMVGRAVAEREARYGDDR